MDTVSFGRVFVFTEIEIEIDTKEAEVMLRPGLTSEDEAAFLQTAMAHRFTGHVAVLQTDGGPKFKGSFAQQARAYCDQHRIARPYKKNEQAYVERFNRTLRKECLSWGTYRVADLPRLIPEVHTFLDRDHYHRPHLELVPLRPRSRPHQYRRTDCRVFTEHNADPLGFWVFVAHGPTPDPCDTAVWSVHVNVVPIPLL